MNSVNDPLKPISNPPCWQVWQLGWVILLLWFVGCKTPFPLNSGGNNNVSRQWTSFGMDALYTGKLSQAKAFFSRAASENPTDQIAHINLARTLKQEQDYETAIVHLQKGIELSAHRDAGLIAELGELYLLNGEIDRAKQQADAALMVDHRCAAARALNGRILMRQGYLEEALAEFQRSLSLEPNQTDVQLLVAEVYRLDNQPLRAMSAIEQVLRRTSIQNQPEEALLAKGIILMSLQQPHAATEVLQLASRRDSPSADTLLRLGQAQLMAGQTADARSTLQYARDQFPYLNDQLAGLLDSLSPAAEQVVVR